MKRVGYISLHSLPDLVFTILHPWVALGILFLLAFFAAYMTALSRADLTYVLPATSLGYVLLALIAKFYLHEQVSTLRWVGIGLISWRRVRHGPATRRLLIRTSRIENLSPWVKAEPCGTPTWGAIMAVVLASYQDVLLSRHEESERCREPLSRRAGHSGVAHPAASQLHVGHFMMAMAFFSLLFALPRVSLVAPPRLPHFRR
jgi:hypothetical protein